ncbi:MAG: AtpZ/AtpI family protein [Bryobacterales bacterium]|nr:AtpZ/AtpI family protein [Bryobacteraceae bacterium]MDW8129262.1 AtpZ/AtpI family protein [Bryobacterales bacterium]
MAGKRSGWALVGRYSGLAFLLPATTFAGYVVGWLLDRWLGTGFLYLVFLLAGIAGGFIELVRTLRRDLEDERS